MPTYDYKCNKCDSEFIESHSINEEASGCPSCESEDIKKVISSFATRTETSFDHMMRRHEEQAVIDRKRFAEDDKFAANITGADDLGHKERLNKVVAEQNQKSEQALKNFREQNKRVENE